MGYQAKAASSSLLTVNVALQELRDKDEDEDPEYPKPFNMRYDPTGDNVPVQKRQIFRFAKQELAGIYLLLTYHHYCDISYVIVP